MLGVRETPEEAGLLQEVSSQVQEKAWYVILDYIIRIFSA